MQLGDRLHWETNEGYSMFKLLARLFSRKPPAVIEVTPPPAPSRRAEIQVARTASPVPPRAIRRGESSRPAPAQDRRNADDGFSSPLNPLNPVNTLLYSASDDTPSRSHCSGHSSGDSYSSSSSSSDSSSCSSSDSSSSSSSSD